jgi:hypothetical protein
MSRADGSMVSWQSVLAIVIRKGEIDRDVVPVWEDKKVLSRG